MTLADVLRWLEQAPDGTLLAASALLSRLREIVPERVGEGTEAHATPSTPAEAGSWQERLWAAPAETRMTVSDVCEALGRPKSWCYRHTSPASGLPRLPHRKLDGELVFLAGEVRQWVREHEDIVVQATSITPISARRRRRPLDRVEDAS